MLDLVNRSDWAAALFPGWDADRRAVVTIVVKARYRLGEAGDALVPANPSAIEPADRHRGEPAESSLLRAGDGVPFKLGGECLFHGTVRPTQPGQRARAVTVALVTDAGGWTKRLQVTGCRRWKRTLLGLVPTEPEPLEPTELRYEHAFGGVDVAARELDTRNPVGTGFHARRAGARGAELPRIEYADAAITRWSERPPPAGLGPVAADWQPRRALSEGLDEQAAVAGRCPYADPVPAALFNAAPEDQRIPAPFCGGERVTVEGFGLACERPITFGVPAFQPDVRHLAGQQARRLASVCDTVEVDMDAGTVDLTARARVAVDATQPAPGWVLVSDPERRGDE